MKLRALFSLLAVLVMVMLAACSNVGSGNSGAEKEPQKQEETSNGIGGTVTGVVQWAAGGAADTVSRAIAPLVEKELGQSIVVTNKPGATGAIALQYVLDQKSDGRTILFAAENPALYGVLDISHKGFEDLYPINIFSGAMSALIVPKDSKYQTPADLIDDAKANPGKIQMGSTGPGGQPFVVSTMLSEVTGAEFNLVPYDGDGPLVTAVLGKHLDASAVGLTAALESAKAGEIKILALIHNEPLEVEGLGSVVPITDDIPEMDKFLPWGPFYGAWVKNDTPDNIKQELIDAFGKAQQEKDFQDFVKRTNGVSLGLSGDDAVKFWKEWQSKTAWLLHDAGVTKTSPEEFNIEKMH
ncbi:tripartite tricarboxylate transporter substrate binding protein [Bacillus timonensis]|uniref:Tripartite tricarboxylate transporter substrate binding protein n=1 Tax=Bacillus timonensis TaxID=1033734 RepID=A0A4S3PLX5_9BACI|nr:tripartite tricarboxylate transporter substrate binding protein [Bacillus timonensis]THE10517.1 tripartite tricarboxylate transporter substrate binding protein [Bacillus timonensis]